MELRLSFTLQHFVISVQIISYFVTVCFESIQPFCTRSILAARSSPHITTSLIATMPLVSGGGGGTTGTSVYRSTTVSAANTAGGLLDGVRRALGMATRDAADDDRERKEKLLSQDEGHARQITMVASPH
ncbi:unnamed protein product [Callosobruchus maculatus]|uniref:Uncharacterized protein n=1 Tax=Callosobruchus maculatus TaxID=64391 RepID=A0A653BLX6_CALMS|nr:unnamed protein product [Callosobruchus maculatus]